MFFKPHLFGQSTQEVSSTPPAPFFPRPVCGEQAFWRGLNHPVCFLGVLGLGGLNESQLAFQGC